MWGCPIRLKKLVSALAAEEPVLTLHLPAELAATQPQVWCLACRLACFCPDARVSVLVLGAAFSGQTQRARKVRRHVA